MFNLDELVKTEEIKLNGEVLHIRPILKGFSDKFQAKAQSLNKKIKAEKVEANDIEEIYKLVVEFLSNNEEEKIFSLKDLDEFTQSQITALIQFISELIVGVEKK